MYKPLISVIVPVYKVEKHIHRCIESVLKQTYANWELILVDDGSPDSCGRICDAYAARYDNILVIHQENQGLSAARNAGLDRAGGEWVYFLDSDDFIREDTLEKIELFSKNGFYDIVVAGYSVLTADGKLVPCSSHWKEMDDISEIRKKILLDNLSNISCGKLYKKKLWDNFRFPVGLLNEDLYTCPEIFSRAQSACIHAESFYYYCHQNVNSLTNGGSFKNCILSKYSRMWGWEEHARVASKLVLAFERECRQKAIAYAIKAYMLNQGNGILSPKQEAEVKTYLSLHKEIPLSDKKEWQRTCIIENKYKGFMCIVGRLYRIVFNMRNKIRSRKINRYVQK